jgi:hypothetical protein
MNETPLIWTSKGNVPIDSLTYQHKWIDDPQEVTFLEAWIDESGEVVKNNCHKLAKRQLTIGGEQAAMA